MDLEHTGVFATDEETAELKELAETASSTPVIMTHLHGGGPSAWSQDRMLKRCHEIALSHGLPEITGYYGATASGEFVRTP